MDDLGARGRRLWASLMARDAALTDESNPDREVALTACRTADRVDYLEGLTQDIDPESGELAGLTPAQLLAEVRQQSALLARLVAALRLPDEATGRKPQRRPTRGVEQPKSVGSRDRIRAV